MSLGNLQSLGERLTRIGLSTGGRVALSFKNLQTGEVLSINDRDVFPSASLIKLAILLVTAVLIDQGRLRMSDRVPVDPDTTAMAGQREQKGSGVVPRFRVRHELTVEELCILMIIVSDNGAANLLLDTLGFDALNEVLAALGFAATRVTDAFHDLDALEDPTRNPTTAFEIVRLFELLHQGHVPHSRWAIEILRQQHFNSRLPLLLPARVEVAHKTATLGHTSHDAGIVCSPAGEYALCVLTTQVASRGTADIAIAQMSRLVYAAFLRDPTGDHARG